MMAAYDQIAVFTTSQLRKWVGFERRLKKLFSMYFYKIKRGACAIVTQAPLFIGKLVKKIK